MRYPNITRAIFVSRENRFVATVMLNGAKIQVHVKNTGRCRELLTPGATVYLVHSDSKTRKYAYDLVAVEKGSLLINMDSQAPNAAFAEYLHSGSFIDGITRIQPEFSYDQSRIDFYFERGAERHLVEVKGVTLERDGICLFPDAPTLRGTRHLQELAQAAQSGYHSWICFVVQLSGARYLTPNRETDPAFASTLAAAVQAGVQVIALECQVQPDGMQIIREIPVHLDVQEK
jgi:sugar fermentation stimulation protein A